ncbi:MAG: protein kinase [Gemmatimonadaceae bacterium]|nr:protein kinase [Gemmatimonadaceae bacterium]
MDLEQELRVALAGTYRIEHELGGGGMSRVFAAQDEALGRRVAVKVLSQLDPGVSADRFRLEIQTVARLQHPHIMPLLNAGTAGSTLYYTMPLVEGESLRARLDRAETPGLRDAVQFARDIADALVYAHGHGVMHRDVKPDNVLLSGGHAIVTDFGVAKALVASATSDKLTTAGMAIGTPAYMAPEQLLADPTADHRVDLYALGCVLFEMLAGKPPFSAATVQETMRGHLVATPPSLTAIRADVPADVAAWVDRALAKAPDERWPTAEAARNDLDACLARLSGDGVRPSSPALRPRVRPWHVVGASLALAAAAWAYVGNPWASGLDAGPERIAVMPFVATDPADTTLVRLGRDLVVTLTANLDGVGELRIIDPLSVLAQTTGTKARDVAESRALANRLGARRALVGTLVRSGGLARLDYRLVPTSGSEEPVASGSVAVPLGDSAIMALTDSATWGLLARILPAQQAQVPSFAVQHTRSIPALRAFIDGENHLLGNRWEEAERAYARAIEADSTFWFAYRRVYQAADWNFTGFQRSRELAIANEHIAGFPERERLLMTMPGSGHYREAREQFTAITGRFPDFWQAWFLAGDHILHYGIREFETAQASMPFFERAFELNPRLAPILDHQVFLMGDSAIAERAYVRFRNVFGTSWDTARTDYGVPMEALYGAVRNRYREGRFTVESLDRLASDIVTSRVVPTLVPFLVGAPVLTLDPAGQIAIGGMLASHGAPPATMQSVPLWESAAWAMRGALDSSFAVLDRARVARPSMALARTRATLAVLAEVTGEPYRSVAAAALKDFASIDVSPQMATTRARLAGFLEGMSAYTAGEKARVDSARLRLVSLRDDTAAVALARVLAALRRDLDGDRATALDSLLVAERARGAATTFDYDLTPLIRLPAGLWLAAAGRRALADSVLSFHDNGITSVPGIVMTRAAAPDAMLARARIREQAGDVTAAARFYREFVRLRDLSPVTKRAEVEEATQALARLSR